MTVFTVYRKIEWTDDERLLPGVGFVVKGSVYNVPEEMAKNLISQGQARNVSDVKDKKKSKVN